MPTRTRVLILCTGNTCRSQMAEGWVRALLAETIQVYSGGVAPGTLQPLAVRVMAEVGIDIADHKPQHAAEFLDADIDVIITVCGHAEDTCPTFPSSTRLIHAPFDDPSPRRDDGRSEEQILRDFRRVRDEIRDYVRSLPAELG